MHENKTGTLPFNPNILKNEHVLLLGYVLARERIEQQEPVHLKDYSSNKSDMGDHLRITLGDCGRLNNLEEISLRFQLTNPVVFDIKSSVLVNLKTNQFVDRESEDCNAHLALFLNICSTINVPKISELDK